MNSPSLPTSRPREALDHPDATLTRHPYLTLGALYVLCVLLHGWISFAGSVLPSILTDELLYLELSKSIYAGGGLLFRGQPIAYSNLLYPLLISPLFGLPEGVNLYTAILVFNDLAIHLMIFPAYALGLEITRRKDAALLTAFLVCLMPDMAMVKHVMAESVAYPLLMTALWLAYRQLKKPTAGGGRGLGALCWLLYLLKPGYAALGAVSALALLLAGLRGKDRARLVCGANALGALLIGLWPGMYLMRLIFRVDMTQTSLYAAQTWPLSAEHLLQTGLGALQYADFTLIAFGVLPLAATFAGLRAFPDERKTFCAIVLASLAVMLLGTVYVIYFDEYMKTANVPARVHLRYVSFFLPVCAAVLCADEIRPCKMRGTLLVTAELLAVGLFLFPMSRFEGNEQKVVDSALLSAMLLTQGAWNGKAMYLPAFLACALPLGAFVTWRGFTAGARRAALTLLIALLMGNQAAMYCSDRYAMNLALDADARAVQQVTGGDALYLCEDGGALGYEALALSVHSRCDIVPVELSMMAASTAADGSAASILPRSLSDTIYSRAVNPYALRRYLVIDPQLTEQIRFDADVTSVLATEYGSYQVLQMPEDGVWLHSALYGLAENWVWDASGFLLCDQEMLDAGEVTLWLKVRAGIEGAKLTLSTPDGQQAEFAPSPDAETSWIYATFQVTDRSSPFTVSLAHADGNIYVETYAVQAGAVQG